MDEIRKNTLRGELYFFRTVFIITDLVSNGFYYILLYKTTNQFSALFIDLIIFYLAQWAGLIIGNVLIPKFGYIKTFKLGFLLNALVMILLVLNLNNLLVLYPLFAILRSFPRGLYWAVNNNYLMRELSVPNRTRAISDILGITYIFQILLPVLIGATVTLDGDYSILFIISATISLVSLILPWKYNKKPRTEITFDEITKILKNPKFQSLSVLMVIHSGLEASIALSIAIVPFLFFRNEFEVGILVTIINLIAAIFAFTQRKKKIEEAKRFSYLGSFIFTVVNTIFILIWTIPALVFRGLFSTVGESLYQPFIEKADLDIREEILGADINKSSAEMGIIMETVFTIGRILALAVFLLGLTLIQNENIFKLIIIIYSLWILVILNSLSKLKHKKETLIV